MEVPKAVSFSFFSFSSLLLSRFFFSFSKIYFLNACRDAMFDMARFPVLNTQIYHTSHYPVPLSLPSAQMSKCNCCLLPFTLKSLGYLCFFGNLMIYVIADASKQSKAGFATIFAFAE